MRLNEYRFAMPMTLEEYERGLRYSVARASLNETGGGQGVELLVNEPFQSDTVRPGHSIRGTYTRKIYHIRKKVPWFIRKVLPDKAFKIKEESWNAFPYTKTVLSNPDYMKKGFSVVVESLHLDDGAVAHNALNLSESQVRERQIVYLDIRDTEHLKKEDMSPETDPRQFRSSVADPSRGPLEVNWSARAVPRIIVYKVVSVHFKWFGLQNRVERSLQNAYPRLFVKLNRELFCWMDHWWEMDNEELQQYEQETSVAMRRNFREGRAVGMVAAEESEG